MSNKDKETSNRPTMEYVPSKQSVSGRGRQTGASRASNATNTKGENLNVPGGPISLKSILDDTARSRASNNRSLA